MSCTKQTPVLSGRFETRDGKSRVVLNNHDYLIDLNSWGCLTNQDLISIPIELIKLDWEAPPKQSRNQTIQDPPCYEGLETRRGHHPRDDWTLVVFSVEAVSALNMTRLRGLGLGATPCRLASLIHTCLGPSQPIFGAVGACEVRV